MCYLKVTRLELVYHRTLDIVVPSSRIKYFRDSHACFSLSPSDWVDRDIEVFVINARDTANLFHPQSMHRPDISTQSVSVHNKYFTLPAEIAAFTEYNRHRPTR